LTRPASRKRRRRRLLLIFLLVVAAAGGARVWLEVRELRRAERVASLQRTRDDLRVLLLALSAKDPVVASAPDAEVLVGVPSGVATEMLGRITTRLVHQLEVVLRDLDVHKAGSVNMKTFLGRTTAGRYRVDLRIHEVTGVLEPGAPKLDFQGERVGVALPVRMARGEGRATLRFRWDSRGIAGVACGDFRARIPVSGRVVPRTYPMNGTFALELVDGALVATPSFPDLKINLQVEPSPETWKEVSRVLAQRSPQCRAALKLVDVPALLRRLLDRGFNVKVPPRIFTPLRLPVRLRREVAVGGRTHVVLAAPRELAVTPRVVWLGADVKSEPGPAPPPAPE
jgi:hypothetical protein